MVGTAGCCVGNTQRCYGKQFCVCVYVRVRVRVCVCVLFFVRGGGRGLCLPACIQEVAKRIGATGGKDAVLRETDKG